MNILFVLKSVSSRSGVDIVTKMLAEEFINLGYNVNLCATEFLDNINPKIKCFYIFDDLKKIIEKENINIIINQECQNKSWVKMIKKRTKNSNVKIISCLHFPPIMSTNYFGKRAKYFPKFISNAYKKYRDLKAVDYARKNSDSLVLLSKEFLKEYKKNATVIANPIEIKNINLAKKQKTILFVGRISEYQKRISFILEIWKIILNSKMHDDWNLKIVGEGEDLKSIKENAVGLDRIYFEGKQKVAPYFEEASIFFMTSSFEGLPMTLVEAQSFGCVPIVMDSFSALKDIITNYENGIISANNDTQAFAKNAMLLMENDELRSEIAINGIKSVEKFDIKKIALEWKKLFELLEQSSQR